MWNTHVETPMWKSWTNSWRNSFPVPEVGSSNIKMLGLAASSKPQNPTGGGGEGRWLMTVVENAMNQHETYRLVESCKIHENMMGMNGIPIGNGSSSSCKLSTNSCTARNLGCDSVTWEFTVFFGFPSFACWLFMFHKKGGKNCFFTTIVWMVKVATYSYLLSTARESVALRRCLGYPLIHNASDHSTRRMKKSYPFSCEAPKSEASQLHVSSSRSLFVFEKWPWKKQTIFFSKSFHHHYAKTTFVWRCSKNHP